jgi:hypothetical protein
MQDILMASVVIFEPNASFPGQPPYSVSWNVSSSNASTIFVPIQVSYPQQIVITVTVTSSDAVVLTKSKTVDIVNCTENQGLSGNPQSGSLEHMRSIDKNEENRTTVTLYPNPASDMLTLLYPKQANPVRVQVIIKQ